MVAGALPVKRGELSAAQFCENYNQLQAFYQVCRPVNVPDTPIYNYIDFSQLPQLEFLGDPESITIARQDTAM